MLKHQDLQMNYRSNFQPLQVVGHGSETQLQVGEKFKFCNVAL